MATTVYACYAAFVLHFLGCLVTTASISNNKCPSVCGCLGFVVDCSKKELTEIPPDLPMWTETLVLRSNSIREIPADVFKRLNNLKQLDLSNNELKSFNSSAFQYLPALHELKLSYNHLSVIPSMEKSGNVSHFDLILHHNDITNIDPNALASMPKLRNLDLNFNKIKSLRIGDFPSGTVLHHLFLNNNGLSVLEKGSLANLTSLEWLKLNRNRLLEIKKDAFTGLVNLKYLELNRNKIKIVESLGFLGLKKLRVLKLRRNSISKMDDGSFWGLDNIQVLKLDRNNLTIISQDWLYGLSSLQQLSLDHNQINQINPDSLKDCRLLWNLELSYNKLTGIVKDSFKNLHSLKFLLLNHNKISNLGDDAFLGLSSLEILNLDDNEISRTIEDMNGAFSGLSKLRKLSLQNNQITSITKHAFSGLHLLKSLHLSNNAINTIQGNAFAGLTSLEEIDFNSTTFLCDCKLTWLPAWLEKSGFHTSVNAVCAHPEWLKGRNILKVPLEDYKCEDFPKPIIIKEPKSQIAIKKGNITLECAVASSSNSPMQFQWKKNNNVVKNADVENYASTGDGRVMRFTTLLHLRSVADSDAGRYQCIVSNEFGKTYSQRAKIVVHVFPTFTKTPMDITVQSSSTARLECAAKGQPMPQIAWQKDGGDDFPAARERRMHVMPTDDVFFIVNVKPTDAGIYSCTATNDAGTVLANATLSVLETPSFIKRMKDREARVGETTVLECMATGSPKPKLSWLKDGKPLVLTPRHFFTADGQLLIIIQTKATDAGQYTCEMSNDLGTKSDSASLTVTGSTNSQQMSNNDAGNGFPDNSTTIGIIVIAVVCCVVGTSLIWVIIIYKTRKKNDEYSSTPTDEITLPIELPSASTSYQSSEREGRSTPLRLPITYSVHDLATPTKEQIYCNGHIAMQCHSDDDATSRGPLVGFDNRASSISSASPPRSSCHGLPNVEDYQRLPPMQTFQAYPPLDNDEDNDSVQTSVDVVVHSQQMDSSLPRSRSSCPDHSTLGGCHGTQPPPGCMDNTATTLPHQLNTSHVHSNEQQSLDNSHRLSLLSHLPVQTISSTVDGEHHYHSHLPSDVVTTDSNSNNIEPGPHLDLPSSLSPQVFSVLTDSKSLPHRTLKV